MNDARRLKRENTVYYLSVFDTPSDDEVGKLVDITIEGCMLICDAPVEPDKTFQLRIVLPRPIAGASELIFAAESRWCRPAENIDFFNTGFAIKDISPKDRSLVELLIKFYSFSGQIPAF